MCIELAEAHYRVKCNNCNKERIVILKNDDCIFEYAEEHFKSEGWIEWRGRWVCSEKCKEAMRMQWKNIMERIE